MWMYPDKEMLVGFEQLIENGSLYNKSSQGKHIFSVVQSMLESGNYVLSWNGLSYEFEVGDNMFEVIRTHPQETYLVTTWSMQYSAIKVAGGPLA